MYLAHMYAGIVPLRSPHHAKKRLAGRFSEIERRALAEAMCDDALRLALATDRLRWWVVSDSEDLRARARALGLDSVADEGTDLNAALAAAIAEVSSAGAEGVVIVPGDLPLVTSEDLSDLLDTAATSDVVVVPSGEDGGTNGLALTPPDLMPPHFGPASLQAHVADAEDRGLRCTVLALDRMALDLDTPEDAERIVGEGEGHSGATVTLLRELLSR